MDGIERAKTRDQKLGGDRSPSPSDVIFKESGWDQSRIVSSTHGADSILEHTLVDDPDFSDPDALTRRIEKETLKFIENVENFLSKPRKVRS